MITTNEAICSNCKGKGTSFTIKLKKWLRGVGTVILALIILVLVEDGPAIIGWILIAMLIGGVVQMILARIAKCPVCEGTGKVELTTTTIEAELDSVE